jgi:hypothetical protein
VDFGVRPRKVPRKRFGHGIGIGSTTFEFVALLQGPSDLCVSFVDVEQELRDRLGLTRGDDPAVLGVPDLQRDTPRVGSDDRNALVDCLGDFDLEPLATASFSIVRGQQSRDRIGGTRVESSRRITHRVDSCVATHAPCRMQPSSESLCSGTSASTQSQKAF